MSKKRHKEREREEKCNCMKCRNKSQGNNPFGLNPAQLMSLFGGGADFGKLGNILSSMKTNGFDFNNMNSGSMNNFFGASGESKGAVDINQLQNMLSNMDLGGDEEVNIDSITEERADDAIMDENIEMLLSIKNIVDYKKANFIDKVIKAYREGEFR